jgi:uncharacterized protein YukE
MSEAIRAVLEHLTTSAQQANGQAEEMMIGHATAHGRIEAAQQGWVGLSAPAISAKLARWQATVSALQGRVLDHGQALQTTAVAFDTTETDNARALDQVSAAAPATGLQNL